MQLSVLVPSVHTRYHTFQQRIVEQLFQQYEELTELDQKEVEILILTDNKQRPIGQKRNDMLGMAKGEWVVFVDDDDRLEPDYLKSLLAATRFDRDVIVFEVSVSTNGGCPKVCRYNIGYDADRNFDTHYERLPNHIMAVRRSLALQAGFPEKQCGEDSEYAKRLRPLLKSQHLIERVLYHYDYDTETTETQPRKAKPLVDLVILSRGDTWAKRAMTQRAINSAVTGAWAYTLNIIVVEQAEGVTYRGATTLHEPGKFAYNRFANRAARTGRAEWIMVANNDLVFRGGWLSELLAANYPLVSPRCPQTRSQRGVSQYETGVENGRHLSGWCFMMTRQLFDQIGGLDEDFDFWCADDSLIEQAVAVGVKPMIVGSAQVTHLGSVTGGKMPSDDMTWAQVYRFNKKYGHRKFEGDARYIAWLKRNGLE